MEIFYQVSDHDTNSKDSLDVSKNKEDEVCDSFLKAKKSATNGQNNVKGTLELVRRIL